MNSAHEISSLLERYERKFLIPESMIDTISDFASIYCRPDRYSDQSRDRFYSVYSLYFDSPDFLFLRKKMGGAENRFNMKIRTYDKDRGMSCFLEVKQKRDGIVRKYRAKVQGDNWQGILESLGCWFEGCSEKEKAGLFVRLACSYRASPKVLTCCRRKAWVSDVDDYGRNTFDRELRCQTEKQWNLIPDPRHMCAYDDSTVFDPECFRHDVARSLCRWKVPVRLPPAGDFGICPPGRVC